MTKVSLILIICFIFRNIRTVKSLRKTGSECRRFIWYSLYAWGITIVFTLAMFLLDRYPIAFVLDANIGNGVCWFGSGKLQSCMVHLKNIYTPYKNNTFCLL